MASIAQYLAKMDADMRGGIYTHQVRQTPGLGVGTGQVTAAFPRGGLGAADPRDEIVRMKLEMLQKSGGTGMTELGQVQLTDEDLKYLMNKRATEGEANFDAWLGSNFHTDSVTIRQWLQRIYPKFYDDRESVMINKAKTALRINRILDKGPQDEEDLILQFGLQTGLIKLESDWNVIGSNSMTQTVTMDKQQKRFQARLMAPRRYKTEEQRAKGANASFNPFRQTGTSPAEFTFSGGAVKDPNRYGTFLDKIFKNKAADVTPTFVDASDGS